MSTWCFGSCIVSLYVRPDRTSSYLSSVNGILIHLLILYLTNTVSDLSVWEKWIVKKTKELHVKQLEEQQRKVSILLLF